MMIHAFVDLDNTLIYARAVPGPQGYVTKLRPGAGVFLGTLRRHVDRIELLTAGNMEHATRTLEERKLGGFFDTVWSKDKPPPRQDGVPALRVLFDDLTQKDAGDFNWKRDLLHPFVHIQVGAYQGRGNPYPTLRDALQQFETLLDLCRHAASQRITP